MTDGGVETDKSAVAQFGSILDACALLHPGALAEHRIVADRGVCTKEGVIANLGPVLHPRVRLDHHILSEPCGPTDRRRGVDDRRSPRCCRRSLRIDRESLTPSHATKS